MSFAVLMVAVAAAVDARASSEHVREVLLAVNEEAGASAAPQAAPGGDSKISHTPLEKTPRGENVSLQARIEDPSKLFAPLVFVRKTGTSRYEAFTMQDRGRGNFRARLPASILSEGSFEYFVEAQHEEGAASRSGSPRKPFTCVAYDPPPQPVALTIRTAEPGASVRIDDNQAGKTPLTVRLLPGRHTLSITSVDGRTTEQQIDLKPGKKMDLPVDLPRQAGGPATLSVTSDPLEANVLVDGKERGRTPLIVALPPGKHEVVLHKEGRRDVATEIDMPAEQDLSIRLDLAVAVRSGSRLTVTSTPVGASVTLDGGDVGVTPWSAETRPGKHKVSINAVGYVKDERLVQIQMDRDTVVDFAPRRMPGAARLSVETEPPAQVRVDGKELGVSPLSAEVQPGEHQLEITLDGYKTVAQQVAIDAGQGLSVRIPMQRAQAQER